MKRGRRASGALSTLIFSLISLAYVYPLIMMVFNSLKKKAYISRAPFALPDARTYAGLANYFTGIRLTNFFQAMLWSFVITVLSVALILLCASMCAWFISRVRSRATHAVYQIGRAHV